MSTQDVNTLSQAVLPGIHEEGEFDARHDVLLSRFSLILHYSLFLLETCWVVAY